jgi:hypothetical protein
VPILCCAGDLSSNRAQKFFSVVVCAVLASIGAVYSTAALVVAAENLLLAALKEKSLKKNLLPAQLVNTRSAELRTERADRSTDN